jgi:type I restriction enzyme R subunit
VRNIVLLRPINSMIEFKQIIGRGTRLFEGKDYFTVYDFVKAHQHFKDPEWDGEPEPEKCSKCDQQPCICEKPQPQPCSTCGQTPCECEKEVCEKCGQRPCECIKKVKIQLADGKERDIQHTMATTFWHSDGTPMTAQQFMETLFGKLPDLFKSEAELRTLWSKPDTRAKLLQGLAEKGFGKEQLAEMQSIIDAENSDLFDVLAHVAYSTPPRTRSDRAAQAQMHVKAGKLTDKQQAFLDFVLSHYVQVGVDELASDKLAPLLTLKYHTIPDAVKVLGNPAQIGQMFNHFQRYLYANS